MIEEDPAVSVALFSYEIAALSLYLEVCRYIHSLAASKQLRGYEVAFYILEL